MEMVVLCSLSLIAHRTNRLVDGKTKHC